jgi:hypothetical protein
LNNFRPLPKKAGFFIPAFSVSASPRIPGYIMKQSEVQEIAVVKCYYCTNIKGLDPVMYEMQVDEDYITGITAESARFIYDELGRFLAKEGDEQSINSSIRCRITAVDSYLESKMDENAIVMRSHFRMLMQEAGWENCLKGGAL